MKTDNMIRARVKESRIITDMQDSRDFDLKGLTGFAVQEGKDSVYDFHFDERSKKKLPKWWFKQAKEWQYDPDYYVVQGSDLEFE